MVEKICGLCGASPSVDNDIEEWWFGIVDDSGVKKWWCLDCQLSEIPRDSSFNGDSFSTNPGARGVFW